MSRAGIVVVAVLVVACGKKQADAVQTRPDDALGPGDCRTPDDCELVTVAPCCSCCPNGEAMSAKKKGTPMPPRTCTDAGCPPCSQHLSCTTPRFEDYLTSCVRGACFAVRK